MEVIKTLVSRYVAKPGHRFVFSGELPECGRCRFRSACVSKLRVGKVYEVVRVYEIVNRCPALGDVLTVDVEPARVEVALSARASIEGAITTYKHITCRTSCRYSELCRSPWIADGSKVKVLSVLEKLECAVCKDLFRVIVVQV